MTHAAEKPQFPAHYYHPQQGMKYVATEQEAKLLGPGWSRNYHHQEFPKMMHHPQKASIVVNNEDELDELGEGWFESKAEADGVAKKAAEEITEKHAAFLRSRGKDIADAEAARKFVKTLTPKQKKKFMAEAKAWNPDENDDWENPEGTGHKPKDGEEEPKSGPPNPS